MELKKLTNCFFLGLVSYGLAMPIPVQCLSNELTQGNAAAYLSQLGNQWLNQFSQSEISFNGNSLDARSGGVNLLLPLVDNLEELLFTQGGLHRKQQATTLNLGIGYRWFTGSQSYCGSNLFYDHQLGDHYRRFGIGIEWWQNNFGITFNGYLTNQVPKVAQGNKIATCLSPARGVDLRCRYQIPQFPYWELYLQAERYFGNIKCSNSKIVSNQTAMILGVRYTPISLITAGYEFTLDDAHQKFYQLSLQINYCFGVPLKCQLNPQQVIINQQLNGNRFSLVQRNHRITLEKKSNEKLVGSPGSTYNKKNKYNSSSNNEKDIEEACKFFGFSSIEDVLKNPKDYRKKLNKMLKKDHPDKNINNQIEATKKTQEITRHKGILDKTIDEYKSGQ